MFGHKNVHPWKSGMKAVCENIYLEIYLWST